MIGNRLKWVRKQKNLTQKAFAELLSTSSSYISEVEQGKTSPGANFLNSVLRVFNISIDWLLTGDGHPYIKEQNSTLEPCEHGSEYSAPPTCPSEVADVIEIEHMQLVRGFRDKRRALNINRELMDLEQLDAEEFKMMAAYIKGSVDMLRRSAERKKQDDRRQVERRIQDDPGKAPDGPDRRSGTDRRKASSGG